MYLNLGKALHGLLGFNFHFRFVEKGECIDIGHRKEEMHLYVLIRKIVSLDPKHQFIIFKFNNFNSSYLLSSLWNILYSWAHSCIPV